MSQWFLIVVISITLAALFSPVVTLAIPTSTPSDYYLFDINSNRPTAEAVVFAPWFNFVHTVQSIFDTILSQTSFRSISTNFCKFKVSLLTKINLKFLVTTGCN